MEHYPRSTLAITKWCNVCARNTLHRVDDKRVGSCTEHQREGLSKKQQALRELLKLRNEQKELF